MTRAEITLGSKTLLLEGQGPCDHDIFAWPLKTGVSLARKLTYGYFRASTSAIAFCTAEPRIRNF